MIYKVTKEYQVSIEGLFRELVFEKTFLVEAKDEDELEEIIDNLDRPKVDICFVGNSYDEIENEDEKNLEFVVRK